LRLPLVSTGRSWMPMTLQPSASRAALSLTVPLVDRTRCRRKAR
jgi:hypothetical protein